MKADSEKDIPFPYKVCNLNKRGRHDMIFIFSSKETYLIVVWLSVLDGIFAPRDIFERNCTVGGFYIKAFEH